VHPQQSIRRREFLARASVAGTVGLAGLAAMPDDVLAGGRKKKRKKKTKRRKPKEETGFKCLYGARVSHFEDLVGHKFVVHRAPQGKARQTVVLVLKEVEKHVHPSHANRPAHVRKEPFVLLFAGRSGEELKSGIYRFQHQRLGAFEIFIHEMPSGKDPHWTHYEAVFN
jgi:hypothetical protein